MKTLDDQLSQYASYHRDGRNIATHFIGVPMIVLAIEALLARPSVDVGGPVPLSLALLVSLVSAAYYLWLDLRLGLTMTVLLGLSLGFGVWSAGQSTPVWLAIAIGGFVIGWVFQLVGHSVFEGRKPAFLDDMAGLIIGPLFVVTEAVFLLGLRTPLRQIVEARAGRIRRSAEHGTRVGA